MHVCLIPWIRAETPKHVESRGVGEVFFLCSWICERHSLEQCWFHWKGFKTRLCMLIRQSKAPLVNCYHTDPVTQHDHTYYTRPIPAVPSTSALNGARALGLGLGPRHQAPVQLTWLVYSGTHQRRCECQNIHGNRDADIILCIFIMSY